VSERETAEDLLSVRAFAQATGRTRATITQMILEGRLKAIAVREPGRRRFLLPRSAIKSVAVARRQPERAA
jgi:hypothetical protein